MIPHPAASDTLPACPICSSSRREVFHAQLLRKYEVRYFLCDSCGLLQTEEPHWRDEAYGSAIADTDTGLVSRNLDIARKLTGLLYFCFDPRKSYLDFAGGYGMLTRLMRDRGFDFRWHDPYCENVLARGFEWDDAGRSSVGAVTAFEVMEHVLDPVAFIRDAMAKAGTRTIIFTTLLYEGEPPLPQQWWYYSLESGQHISFFRQQTLSVLAEKLGLRLMTNGWFHVLTDANVNGAAFRICTGRFAGLVDAYVRRRMGTKTFDDHQKIAGRLS